MPVAVVTIGYNWLTLHLSRGSELVYRIRVSLSAPNLTVCGSFSILCPEPVDRRKSTPMMDQPGFSMAHASMLA